MTTAGSGRSCVALRLLASLALATACGGSAVIDGAASTGSGGASSSSGGAGAAAGSAVSSAGNSGTACPGGSINFRLRVAAGNSTGYCAGGASICPLGNWLSIRTAGGTELPLDVVGCTSSCELCINVPCPIIACAPPVPIGADGVEQLFEGSYFPLQTCGANISCADRSCTANGNYVARMCAAPNDGVATDTPCLDAENDNLQCVEVPFTWPPAASGTTIEGTLG